MQRVYNTDWLHKLLNFKTTRRHLNHHANKKTSLTNSACVCPEKKIRSHWGFLCMRANRVKKLNAYVTFSARARSVSWCKLISHNAWFMRRKLFLGYSFWLLLFLSFLFLIAACKTQLWALLHHSKINSQALLHIYTNRVWPSGKECSSKNATLFFFEF